MTTVGIKRAKNPTTLNTIDYKPWQFFGGRLLTDKIHPLTRSLLSGFSQSPSTPTPREGVGSGSHPPKPLGPYLLPHVLTCKPHWPPGKTPLAPHPPHSFPQTPSLLAWLNPLPHAGRSCASERRGVSW